MERPGAAAPLVARIEGPLDEFLSSLPARPGVAQLLGPGDRPLMTARPANLRRWVSNKLGASRSLPPGRRPRPELGKLASAVRYAVTPGSFEQRLTCERWLADVVPAPVRRDPHPAWLELDLDARFPRVVVRSQVPARGRVFGPWRDRAAAERALKPLHRLFPLRPCDYTFEPDPELPLGLSCFFAQVRSCAAPCLVRVSEPDYRELARAAADFLGDPARRPVETQAWLPEHCQDARGRALVAERVLEQLDLYPVLDGAVLEARALRVPDAELEAALPGLSWEPTPKVGDDRTWLSTWLHEPRRRAQWLSVAAGEPAPALCARVRVVT